MNMSLEGQLKSKIEQMTSQGMSFNNGGQQVIGRCIYYCVFDFVFYFVSILCFRAVCIERT